MPDTTGTTTRRPAIPVPPELGEAEGGPPAPAEAAESLATAAVDALAVAWTMFRVYQDPRTQDAFRRAVTTLGALPSYPWTLEVHSGGFRHGGLPVATRRQGAAALARAIFARGLAVLGFSAPPTGDDLLRLFEAVSFQGSPPADSPEVAEELHAAGATRLIVVEHSRLTDTPEGLTDTEELVPPSSDPDPGEPRHQDPSHRYLDEYRLLYEKLEAGDFQGLQELVHGFTDSFFTLPREQQTRLFEQFLTRHEEEPFRLLLDQFSQDDLAELAHLLSPGTHPLLREYARIAAEQEGQTAVGGEMLPAEQLVSDRISQMLRSGRAGLRRQVGEALRAQIPGPRENFAAGVRAASALMDLADDAGFARLAHTVAFKAAGACEEGNLARAGAWGGTLLAAASTRPRKEAVRREMEAALRPDVLDGLLGALAEGEEPPATVVALVALFALDQALERLTVEADPVRRDAFLAFLTTAARLRPGPLVRRLGDPRGPLVLRLIEILAGTGRFEAVAGLGRACAHSDSRVRREALRVLETLRPDEAASIAVRALRDPEPALRLQALGILRRTSSREADAGLAAFLDSRPPLAQRLAAIEVLARSRSDTAHATLRRLARRRPWASAAVRETCRAARCALNGGER
ncbi:MAG: HEAT repeat domain-containing protein [Acidimicrobiia bacterium]|nr:HEAT repeat domain-containing protein [Acidimicrobiia bacterium]